MADSAEDIPKVAKHKRGTLWEEINKVKLMEDDAIFESLEELKQIHEEARGFRWKSRKTQSEEDRIRAQYKQWLQAYRLIPQDDDPEHTGKTDDEWNAIMFPADTDRLLTFLRMFLAWVAKVGKGRGAKTRISVKGYVKYRAALMFWTYRTHGLENLPTLPANTLYNRLTELMQKAAKQYGLKISGNINVTQLGLVDLQGLLESESLYNLCIEVSEGHQLSWCLSRTCAVRPGSIGVQSDWQEGSVEYLAFRDFVITRGEELGHFDVIITFRVLKMNRTDIESLMKRPVQMRTLKCYIRTPKDPNNLVFSIVHRVLVIALRRGALEGISTIHELLYGDLHNITFKPEFLDQPVIRASTPRGLAVVEKPVRADSLTAYLRIRGQRAGFQENITFYSLRRRAATDITRKVGPEAAKRVLNHDPNSVTLHLFYADLEPTTDLTAITLDEPIEAGGQSSEMVAKNNPLTLNALTPEAVQRMHGPALNAMMVKIMQNDDLVVRTAKEEKNYRRRVRKAAMEALLSKECQNLRATMTKMDYQKRVDELSKSNTMDKVFELAMQALKKETANASTSSGDAGAAEPTHDNVDAETGFYKISANDITRVAEENLEDQDHPDSDEPILRTLEDEFEAAEDDEDAVTNIPYVTSVEVFMDLLLNNTLNTYKDMKNNPIPCPLCVDDDTIDDEDKAKLWDNKWKLDCHIGTRTHSRLARWKRLAVRAAKSRDDGKFVCTYCAAIGTHKSFDKANLLIRHIRHGSVTSELHDQLKRDDGWYDEDFEYHETDASRTRKRKRSVEKRRALIATLGLRFSDDVELEVPRPVKSHPSLVLGGPCTYREMPTTKIADLGDITMPPLLPRQQSHLYIGSVIDEAKAIERAFPEDMQETLYLSSSTAPQDADTAFELDLGAEADSADDLDFDEGWDDWV